MKSRFALAGFLTIVFASCSNSANTVPTSIQPDTAQRPPGTRVFGDSEDVCQKRTNNTLAQLQSCIREASLMRRLAVFQVISDANPGPDGHGNRDIGMPGYKASVAYVARLMRAAGYSVTVQPYKFALLRVKGTPEFRTSKRGYPMYRDWFPAALSGSGALDAPGRPPSGASGGCSQNDFAGFPRGSIAILERDACGVSAQVANAQAAGASAVILYSREGGAHQARLNDRADIPVIVASDTVGADILGQYRSDHAPTIHIDVRTETVKGTDYNVIADSPYGDTNRVVVIEGHLDAIYGAGMLDNASGSTTILEIGLNMAKTVTKNHLRYIWFGGEEEGDLGSRYYTRALSKSDAEKIVFDVDVDVVATPNYVIGVEDPRHGSDVKKFPPNVLPKSKIGNQLFLTFFRHAGLYARNSGVGNDGTDSNQFAQIGIPDSGILTQQDCCKPASSVKHFGGFLGNYEGKVPGRNGGCVDNPHRWCDNLYNNDPFVFEFVSKAVQYVTYKLADNPSLRQ